MSRQAGGRDEQPRHIGLGEDVRCERLMTCWEGAGVWNKTLGLRTSAIKAEVVDIEHPITANPRGNVFVSPAPTMKSCSVQVWILAGLIVQEAVHRLKVPGHSCKTTAQGSLEAHVPYEDGSKQ